MLLRKKRMEKTVWIIMAFLLLCSGCALREEVESSGTDSPVTEPETAAPIPELVIETEIDSQTEPETEPVILPYCEEIGAEVEPLTDFCSTGIIYYKDNPERYHQTADCFVTVNEVTIAELEEEQCQMITVSLGVAMEGIYTADGIDFSECITASFELCDYYTGRIFPARETSGDDAYEGSVVLEYDDIRLDIVYSCEVSFGQEGWIWQEEGFYTKKLLFDVVYKIKVPKNYDGVLLAVVPVTKYTEESSDFDTEKSRNEDSYISDEQYDGVKLFQVGGKQV